MNVLADAASLAAVSKPTNDCPAPALKAEPSSPIVKKKTAAPKLQHILMKLLNDESAPEAIWWLPGEREFAINADLFVSQVLEVHFPGSKYASFIRRLHKLGFSRETRSLKKVYGTLPPRAVAFRHEKFRRDKPELMDELKNGYWKEVKARKQQALHAAAAEAGSVASCCSSSAGPSCRSPSPPTMASPSIMSPSVIRPPLSAISLPQMISIAPPAAALKPAVVKTDTADLMEIAAKDPANANLLLILQQNLEEQRRVEERERELLLLIQQRKEQQQQQQEQQQRRISSPGPSSQLLPPSTLYGGADANLLRLQLLQQEQQRHQMNFGAIP